MTLPAVRSSGQWDPFREFDDLYRQMGRWLTSVTDWSTGNAGSWSPAADVTEADDAYLVEVDLPGVKRDDITIDLLGTELTINGELRTKERQGLFRHRTRRTGQFTYQVTLPHSVDADKIEATLADGVLTVRVPKSESAKPRRIAISGR